MHQYPQDLLQFNFCFDIWILHLKSDILLNQLSWKFWKPFSVQVDFLYSLKYWTFGHSDGIFGNYIFMIHFGFLMSKINFLRNFLDQKSTKKFSKVPKNPKVNAGIFEPKLAFYLEFERFFVFGLNRSSLLWKLDGIAKCPKKSFFIDFFSIKCSKN